MIKLFLGKQKCLMKSGDCVVKHAGVHTIGLQMVVRFFKISQSCWLEYLELYYIYQNKQRQNIIVKLFFSFSHDFVFLILLLLIIYKGCNLWLLRGMGLPRKEMSCDPCMHLSTDRCCLFGMWSGCRRSRWILIFWVQPAFPSISNK